MAIVTTDDKHYKDIADKMRYGWGVAYNENTSNIKFSPPNMAFALGYIIEDGFRNSHYKGYTEGKAEGITEGIEQGIEQGKQDEYNAFWDAFQKNGTEPIHYGYAFANKDLWTQENIEKMKHKNFIANYFSVVFVGNTSITDLSAFSFGVVQNQWGEYTKQSLSSTFSGCTNLKKCMPINCDMVYAFTNAFNDCTALEELILSGSLVRGGLDLHWSTKLNKASIESVINALSTTTNGHSVTFSQTAVNNAFTSDEWSALIATRQNWTISLV